MSNRYISRDPFTEAFEMAKELTDLQIQDGEPEGYAISREHELKDALGKAHLVRLMREMKTDETIDKDEALGTLIRIVMRSLGEEADPDHAAAAHADISSDGCKTAVELYEESIKCYTLEKKAS